MATEEIVAPVTDQTPDNNLPGYPEIIVSAIKELNEKEGSNKTSITKQIETVHKDLDPAHATLVSQHLDQMKQSNQLVFVKNNYLIPDPTSPPPQRRGRGRPPKNKTSAPKANATVGKKRGRPAKVVSGDSEKSVGGEVKRGRGRPPKVKESAAAAAAPVGA